MGRPELVGVIVDEVIRELGGEPLDDDEREEPTLPDLPDGVARVPRCFVCWQCNAMGDQPFTCCGCQPAQELTPLKLYVIESCPRAAVCRRLGAMATTDNDNTSERWDRPPSRWSLSRADLTKLAGVLGVLGEHPNLRKLMNACVERAAVLAKRACSHRDQWVPDGTDQKCRRCGRSARALAATLPASVLIEVARAAGPEHACEARMQRFHQQWGDDAAPPAGFSVPCIESIEHPGRCALCEGAM